MCVSVWLGVGVIVWECMGECLCDYVGGNVWRVCGCDCVGEIGSMCMWQPSMIISLSMCGLVWV